MTEREAPTLVEPRVGAPAAKSELDEIVPQMYEDMRALAVRMLSDRGAAVTLQPTSLVHEAYLRLLNQRQMGWQDRLHFFRIAARIMRRVLADHCRGRLAAKRGGAAVRVELSGLEAESAPRIVDVLAIDRLLEELESFDPERARIVELRYFSGLTLEETARALGTSKATVKRQWTLAKAWLARELGR
ncbi:MAG: ECF-type sigma factor [Holophagales bacterium]|nr:ECF-type sigma factor [Holophagales bacterium]